MPTYGNYKKKVLSAIARRLQQDAYLQTLVAGRVYPQHISTINDPVMPCITLACRTFSDPSMREVDYTELHIDVWSKKDPAELQAIYSDHDYVNNVPVGVKALLNSGPSGEAYGFDITEALVGLCREKEVEDNLYEDWSRTHHLAAVYELIYAAKRV